MKDTNGATILIVDDHVTNVHVLTRILARAGYPNVVGTSDARQAVPLFLERRPDLVLLDLVMPYLDGFAILEQLQHHVPRDTYLPVLVLTADISPEARQRALSMGARDFLGKPFDAGEVLLRIKNLLEARFLHLELQEQNAHLEDRIRQRTRELEAAQVEIIERLALAAEYRDDETHQHTRRVAEISAHLARRLGLGEERVGLIRLAAPLHDLGKISIPDQLLLKLDHLTPDEFLRMKAHADAGARILSGSRFPLLQLAEQIARTHHEHWNGEGYGSGLAGESIPLASRIVAIADVFDALTHPRPYKRAWSVAEAVEEIRRQRGRQFDPRIVDAFLELVADGDLLRTLGLAAPGPGRPADAATEAVVGRGLSSGAGG
jgi:putative two-component system response regulator